jgi:hypothetical protein
VKSQQLLKTLEQGAVKQLQVLMPSLKLELKRINTEIKHGCMSLVCLSLRPLAHLAACLVFICTCACAFLDSHSHTLSMQSCSSYT